MQWTDKTSARFASVDQFLGRTIPDLLDESCDHTPSDQAFHQWIENKWKTLSNAEFRLQVESIALGFSSLGLQKGDRIALLMHSNVNFCMVDLGCLLANLVDVPLDLTQTLEHIIFGLQHSETKGLVISNLELLNQVLPYLHLVSTLQVVVVVDVPQNWQETRSKWLGSASVLSEPALSNIPDTDDIPEAACLLLPAPLHAAHPIQEHGLLPRCIQLFSLDDLQQQAQQSPVSLQQLRETLSPHDLATIVYIPDAAGQPQGVMLSHENLSANALTAFAELSDLGKGNTETILSFLPLNHVFARVLLYGHMQYGHSIYFTTPSRVIRHLKEIQPTILATVPLLLEKIHSKILEKGSQSTSKLQLLIFTWAWALIQQYELGKPPGKRVALMLKLADRLVFAQWRSIFGNRLKYLICGGAPLKAEFVNQFAAVGITVLQGYGLTQASAVVCCNRKEANRAGTVGKPIAGVELELADDGEVLVRSPFVMQGYYKDPMATQEVLDEQGWLHTGDLGRFTDDGFLQITGLKKSLFKLSTGKYIAPHSIEARLQQSVFVERAIVIGSEQKFCAALIVPNLTALHQYALDGGIDSSTETLLHHPCVQALYQSFVDAANCHLPYWAAIKRFQLITLPLVIEPTWMVAEGQLNRSVLLDLFTDEIQELYVESSTKGDKAEGNNTQALAQCPPLTAAQCSAFTQSLNPRLTT